MANLLWGNVYFADMFAGYLREETGNRITFTYDSRYISAGNPAIAYSLPVQEAPHISYHGLHPFFDNLVSEGWLEQAQNRLLGKRVVSRFERLLAFGFDCAGAVSVIDPEPAKVVDTLLDPTDPKEMALLTSRASLSGVQPKLTVVKVADRYRPARIGELSTHIAKFSSVTHPDILETEYLTTTAFNALLPDDTVVAMHLGTITGLDKPALLIQRFDRKFIPLENNPKDLANNSIAAHANPFKIQRVHFEEFNQLLAHRSNAKYDGAYKDMADFISQEPACLPTQNYKLYRRILAGLLLGNTDMHFKNFAMLHTDDGLRFTPSYDQIAAYFYKYKTVALSIAGVADLPIATLKPTTMIKLGDSFGLSRAAIKMATDSLAKHLTVAKHAIATATVGSDTLKDNLINLMEKRWNGTVALIGKILSKKP